MILCFLNEKESETCSLKKLTRPIFSFLAEDPLSGLRTAVDPLSGLRTAVDPLSELRTAFGPLIANKAIKISFF